MLYYVENETKGNEMDAKYSGYLMLGYAIANLTLDDWNIQIKCNDISGKGPRYILTATEKSVHYWEQYPEYRRDYDIHESFIFTARELVEFYDEHYGMGVMNIRVEKVDLHFKWDWDFPRGWVKNDNSNTEHFHS